MQIYFLSKVKGVVRVQALKCSASEALNAESYNTLPNILHTQPILTGHPIKESIKFKVCA